jgi:hypothetical protein
MYKSEYCSQFSMFEAIAKNLKFWKVAEQKQF